MINKTICHYKILEKLGGGGMGIVYKAEDSKLGRTVALKFLPPELTRDPEAKKRFIQEAKAASALDHDNICTIYDFSETEDGQLFIAMAFYHGETLKYRITEGPLPIEQAVDIAAKIAIGLQKAHENGIIHRDIKPANIMIASDGRVKILDFGLAKLVGESRLTKMDQTLGTAAYMSPEQASGEEVDHRTDVWSLGVVLYEMLTGEIPFKGDIDHAIIYSIVNETPTPPNKSPETDRMVARMLAKSARERYQSCDEVITDLKRIRRDSEPALSSADKQLTAKRNLTPIIATAIFSAALVISVIALFQPFSNRQVQPLKPVLFTSLPGMEITPTFSPHGDQIAFSWNGENMDNYDIYVKIIGNVEYERLTDHPGEDINPAWSPDGRLIAFTRIHDDNVSIYTIPTRRGPETRLPVSSSGLGRHLTWSADSKCLAFVTDDRSTETRRILLLNVETMHIDTLTHPDVQLRGDRHPSFSPDGTKLAFLRDRGGFHHDIWVQPYPGGKPVQIIAYDQHVPSGLCWTEDGQDIVYGLYDIRSRGLWRIPSAGGTAEFIRENAREPAISGAAKRLAYVEYRSDQNIWRLDLAQLGQPNNQPARFLASTQPDRSALYSPDGDRIAYHSAQSGSQQIWMCDQDGRNHRQLTSIEDGQPGSPSWSPDGRRIAFDYQRAGNKDIYVLAVEGGVPQRITTRNTEDAVPRWSQDSRWIYFRSDLYGSTQIWKTPHEGGEPVQVTRNGGFAAFESRYDGWLYFSKRNETGIWKMPVEGGEELRVTDHPIHMRNWVLKEEGIYFIRESMPGFTIEFYDLQTDSVTTIAERDELAGMYVDVSPDGRWLLYTQHDQSESDIFLVEDFE
jgi:Tol biopolymer transport system component/tRNA A-37 threonylcarbamoyl transferase component Bud32